LAAAESNSSALRPQRQIEHNVDLLRSTRRAMGPPWQLCRRADSLGDVESDRFVARGGEPSGIAGRSTPGPAELRTEARPSRTCATCFTSSRPASPTAPPATHRTKMPASHPPSVRIAAVSCGASAMSPNRRPPPSAATHHDIKSRPDLDRPQPPSRRAAGADAPCHRLSPPPRFGRDRLIATPSKGAQIPAAASSNRSTVSSCQTSQRKQRLENRDRSRAFPIAANRPAPSFNPAYVRSPFVAIESPRRRPHITLQIHFSRHGL
jgi:hypothetical protein